MFGFPKCGRLAEIGGLRIPVVRFHSRNGCYGIFDQDGAGHSALMPANFTTLPHFSVSSAMSLPKSADEPGSPVPPNSASRVWILRSRRLALISLLSLSMISVGVFFAAPIPYHWLAS